MRRAKKKTPTKIKKSEQTPLPPGCGIIWLYKGRES